MICSPMSRVSWLYGIMVERVGWGGGGGGGGGVDVVAGAIGVCPSLSALFEVRCIRRSG